MKSILLLLFYFTLLFATSIAFNPKKWSPYSGSGDGHFVITEDAAEHAAVDFLTLLAKQQNIEIPDTVSKNVKSYCSFLNMPCSKYESAVADLTEANSRVDDDYANLARYHFDAESFKQADTMLIKNKQAVVLQINGSQSFQSARELAGKILHTLQDFYSHSNWIEMNEVKAHRHLARSLDLGTLAEPDQATCSDCNLGPGQFTCKDNILPEILEGRILTSGYYGGQDIVKPEGVGKCSHGGQFDTSRNDYANGGINKDVQLAWFAPHQYLQQQAVDTATDATYHFLLDIMDITGTDYFGQFLGLTEPITKIFIFDANLATCSLISSIVEQVIIPNEFKGVEVVNYVIDGVGIIQKYSTQELLANCKAEILSVEPVDIFQAMKTVMQEVKTSQTTINLVMKSTSPGSFNQLRPFLKKMDITVNLFYENDRPSKDVHDLVRKTGGTVVPVSIFQDSRQKATARESSDDEVLVLLYEDKMTSALERTVYFNVDPTIDELIIRIEAPNGGLTDCNFISPPGKINITEKVERLPNFISYRIAEPAIGQWTLEVLYNAVGEYFTAAVSGHSDLKTEVQVGKVSADNSNHFAGFISFEGEPIAGFNGSVEIDIGNSYDGNDEIENLKVQLVSNDYKSIFIEQSCEGNISSGFIAENVIIPSENFRIRLIGNWKKANSPLERWESRLYDPVPFFIKADDKNNTAIDSAFVQVNVPLQLPFVLRYFGNATKESFKLYAIDNLNVTESVEPTTLQLGFNETGYFSVNLMVSSKDLIGYVAKIEIYAEDSDGNVNYVLRSLVVMPEVIDILAPKFTDMWFEDEKCVNLTSSDCHTYYWQSKVEFFDNQNGLLDKYAVRILEDISDYQNGSIEYEISDLKKGETNRKAKAEFKMDCCIAEFELLAIDTVGNLDAAYFSNALKPEYEAYNSYVEWWVYVVGVIGGLLLLALIAGIGFYIFVKCIN